MFVQVGTEINHKFSNKVKINYSSPYLTADIYMIFLQLIYLDLVITFFQLVVRATCTLNLAAEECRPCFG